MRMLHEIRGELKQIVAFAKFTGNVSITNSLSNVYTLATTII
jgi:hypothetical protein